MLTCKKKWEPFVPKECECYTLLCLYVSSSCLQWIHKWRKIHFTRFALNSFPSFCLVCFCWPYCFYFHMSDTKTVPLFVLFLIAYRPEKTAFGSFLVQLFYWVTQVLNDAMKGFLFLQFFTVSQIKCLWHTLFWFPTMFFCLHSILNDFIWYKFALVFIYFFDWAPIIWPFHTFIYDLMLIQKVATHAPDNLPLHTSLYAKGS